MSQALEVEGSHAMESLVSHKIDYTPMPITATFAGLHEFSKLKLFSSCNGVTNMD